MRNDNNHRNRQSTETIPNHREETAEIRQVALFPSVIRYRRLEVHSKIFSVSCTMLFLLARVCWDALMDITDDFKYIVVGIFCVWTWVCLPMGARAMRWRYYKIVCPISNLHCIIKLHGLRLMVLAQHELTYCRYLLLIRVLSSQIQLSPRPISSTHSSRQLDAK